MSTFSERQKRTSPFAERIRKRNQVMIAGLISIKTKDELDRIAKATRRSKSGCIDLALTEWLHRERERISESVAETVA